MPKLIKQIKLEITGQEIEKLVEDHARQLMREQGYELDYSRNESEQPFPDMMYRGQPIR